MDFFASAVLGGILYDLIKAGVTNLTTGKVFEKMYYSNIDDEKCQNFLDEINDKPDISSKIEYTNTILTTENKYTTFFERELYNTNFAKRLDYALTLINDTDGLSRKLNVESLGEILGLQSVNELKKYYITTEEPTYEFIEMVADKLGINPKWMKAGEGNIFKSELKRLHRGMELFQESDYDEIQEFIIAMLDVPYERYIVLVRRMNEVKYEYYPKALIFYRSGGCEGPSQLYSVYEMLRKLDKEFKMPSGVYLLNETTYNNLLQGKIYPGSIKKERYEAGLLDDFIRLKGFDKQRFMNAYGKTFLDAQDCVLEEIKYRKENDI